MRKLTVTDGLILLAFVIGLAIRLIGLNLVPLNDAEAKWALQALQIAKGGTGVGAQAGTVLGATVLFAVFSAETFWARFFSAFIGSLIALAPWFFRKPLGDKAAIILSFALALDPLLVGTSRQMDGLGMAVALLALSAGLFLRGFSIPSGICLGLFLLSGPAAWLGLLTLLLTAAAWRLIFGRDFFGIILKSPETPLNWFKILLGLVGALFAAGTLFMQVPTGLSGLFDGLAAFWNGWKTNVPQMINGLMALSGGLAYGIMALTWGLVGAITGLVRKRKVELAVTAWLLITLAILILYPATQIRDWAWMVLPLCVLASRQIERTFSEQWTIPAIIQAVVTLVLLLFVLANLDALTVSDLSTTNIPLRWAAIGIGLLIILLTGFLISWGWHISEASLGAAFGLLVVLAGFTFMNTWRSAGLNGKINLELISQAAAFPDQDLVQTSIYNLSEWNVVGRTGIDVVDVGVDSDALKWTLRNMEHFSYVSGLEVGSNPSILITPSSEKLQQTELYTGQEFVLRQIPQWKSMTDVQWLGWLLHRDAPVEKDTAILWARSNLFPGATKTTP